MSQGNYIGHVTLINGLFVIIQLRGTKYPKVGELLKIPEKPEILLLVEECSEGNIYCLNVFGSHGLGQMDAVESTGKMLELPAGDEVFGRVFDAIGVTLDGGAELRTKRTVSYAIPEKLKISTSRKPEVLETGIKVIDFMAPFVKGRRFGILGGAGVGKTVLTTEIIHNVADKKTAYNFFVGIGERIREGHELYHTLKKRGLSDRTVIYLGQMSENAALRSMVGISAISVARDLAESKKDILFFVDNIYRFVQARNELAGMRGNTPSEGGYQPSLFSELHRFEDSLSTPENGSITSVQSIFIPGDDLSDPAVVEISQQLDSTIVLSREVFERGVFPAVDLVNTTSSLINPMIIGQRHYNLVRRVKAIIRKYENLKTIIAIVGESELAPEDRADYGRAKEIIKYFNQDMFVTEDLSGRKGQYFTREQTLKGIEDILSHS